MKYITAILAYLGLTAADTDVLVGKVNGALISLKTHVEKLKESAAAHEESLLKLAQSHDDELAKLEQSFHRRTDALFKRQDKQVDKVAVKGEKIATAIDKGETFLKAFSVEETPAPVTPADVTVITSNPELIANGGTVTVKGE